MIDESDLNHDTLDCSNVDAVLAACEELNTPSKLSTAEGQVESAVANSSLVYGDMNRRNYQNGMGCQQVNMKLELSLHL